MDWEKIFANDVINKGQVTKQRYLTIDSLIGSLIRTVKFQVSDSSLYANSNVFSAHTTQ